MTIDALLAQVELILAQQMEPIAYFVVHYIRTFLSKYKKTEN